MGVAKDQLFLANARFHENFSVRINASHYTVQIPYYVYDGHHFVPASDVKSHFTPIVEAFDRKEFSDENSVLSRVYSVEAKFPRNRLRKFVDECKQQKLQDIKGVPHVKFDGYGDSVWPGIRVLAGLAHHLQLGHGVRKEYEFWESRLGAVKNEPGLADQFRITVRSWVVPQLGAELHLSEGPR